MGKSTCRMWNRVLFVSILGSLPSRMTSIPLSLLQLLRLSSHVLPYLLYWTLIPTHIWMIVLYSIRSVVLYSVWSVVLYSTHVTNFIIVHTWFSILIVYLMSFILATWYYWFVILCDSWVSILVWCGVIPVFDTSWSGFLLW